MSHMYRPETDAQRKQALQRAKTKADATPPATLAFSAGTLAALIALLPTFLTELQERGSALSAQSASTSAITTARRTIKLWISHFFQVFNLDVLREIFPASDRAHYQLDVNSAAGPGLTTDEDIVEWADSLATGEAARVAAGGAAMANPSAAEVAAQYAIFQPLLAAHTSTKDEYDKEQEDVAAIRDEADELIADIWDEVLFTFRKDSTPSMRRKAREYGVVYIPSPGEEPSPEEFSATGTVTTLTGTALADVEVTVEGSAEAVTTDADGRYYVPLLPDGIYTFTFTKMGYMPQSMPGVAVTAGAVVTLDVVMEEEKPPMP